MRTSIQAYLSRHPFRAGVIAALGLIIGGGAVAAAANHAHPFILGTVEYDATTNGPVILGINSGAGVGVEGVTNTGSPAGAIALDGLGTSSTVASVGVNGSVFGPSSTALIGNSNATSGAPSIGLEGFSHTGEGVFAQSLSSSYPGLRAVDANNFYNVLLGDTPDQYGMVAQLNASVSDHAAILGEDTVSSSSSNIGILGTTASGLYGVEGEAFGDALDGVFGSITSTSGGAGVAGSSVSGIGTFGVSTNANGVWGQSANNDGTDGFTANPSASQAGRSGVYGLDNSSDGGSGNFGITGQSANGAGVQGNASGFGTGVLGTANTHIGVLGTGAQGTSAVGVWGVAPFGVIGDCTEPSGFFEFYGQDNGSANFDVNCSGVPSAFLRTRHNMYVNPTFEKTTQSVIEDYGEAQLVNGVASVRLDPAFAESITDRAPYLVFVTPDGDTNGLYVTNKTLHGFDVHEVRGGRSSLTFDYRIVGHPTGDGYTRMALTSSPPRVPQLRPGEQFGAQRAQAMLAQHVAAFRRMQALATANRKQALAQSQLQRLPGRLPLYEPRMGPNGKLVPGQPYTPPAKPHR